MDDSNYKNLLLIKKNVKNLKSKVNKIGIYDTKNKNADVKDPYYGEINGFEEIYYQLNDCIDNFLKEFL
jgi:protein-tyrosine-phosphatase